MASGRLHVQPVGEALERVAGEVGRSDLGEQPDVERARARPCEAGTTAFPLQHGEVEADRVADEDGTAEALGKLAPQLGEGRRVQHGRGVDAVDAGRAVGDRHVRPDQAPIGPSCFEPPAGDRHQRDLDDARLARVEAGRLGVDGQRVESQERRGAACRGHRRLRFRVRARSRPACPPCPRAARQPRPVRPCASSAPRACCTRSP